jgi:hypothetical protein
MKDVSLRQTRLMFDVTNFRLFFCRRNQSNHLCKWLAWNSEFWSISVVIISFWIEHKFAGKKCFIIYKLVKKATLFPRRFYAMNFEVNYNATLCARERVVCAHVIFSLFYSSRRPNIIYLIQIHHEHFLSALSEQWKDLSLFSNR